MRGTGAAPELRVAVDDPARPDVRHLLELHLAFANHHSLPEDVHALEPDRMTDPAITLCSARAGDGRLLGIGALRQLDAAHGELKAMHTVGDARRQGVGRALLAHLLDVARQRGYRRVSLETGSQDAFAPARTLYRTAGFAPCPPFGGYAATPNSVCMTLSLDPVPAPGSGDRAGLTATGA